MIWYIIIWVSFARVLDSWVVVVPILNGETDWIHGKERLE